MISARCATITRTTAFYLSLAEHVIQRRWVDSVNTDQLLTRTLAAHDRHHRRRDSDPASDHATQRAVRTAVDRRRGHPRKQHAIAETEQLVLACTSLHTNLDPRIDHGIR